MDPSIEAYDAIAAKEQMLAIVSHDIKNPLSAIQLEAQVLLRAAERNEKSVLSEEVKIQAKRILKITDRLKLLISDLLEKNKSEVSLTHLQKQEVHLQKLICEVLDSVRPLIQEKNLTLKVLIPDEESYLSLDRNKMFQVLANLINNAIKFTPESGMILLQLEQLMHEFVFHVKDTGPGLKAEHLPRVFNKYWTGDIAECAGTGLGLFICKTIVEAHKGKISVNNLSEGGAHFTFNLPKSDEVDLRKKIYIVDDDEDLRDVICWALENEGYALHSFQNPVKALEMLKSVRHRPDLFIVDFHMDEMMGSEFVLRKNELGLNQSPVIMISASPKSVESEISSQHYREIITKPIDLMGLVDNIKSCLNGPCDS